MAGPSRSEKKKFDVEGAHVLIIESPYYAKIIDMLVEGAVGELDAAGATYERISVPGALEIPQALREAAQWGIDMDGAIALGCVIRGETSHYDIVCNNANHWLYETAQNYGIPVGNAILTVDTEAQAIARAQGGRAGKGGDAARACLTLIALRRNFEERLEDDDD